MHITYERNLNIGLRHCNSLINRTQVYINKMNVSRVAADNKNATYRRETQQPVININLLHYKAKNQFHVGI